MKELFHAIALTGGIATGKSTISSLLMLRGFTIIDLDKITHELLALHVKKIAAMFGDEYVEENRVNREKLGSLVFSQKEAKEKLENFLHPLIRQETHKEAIKKDSLNVPYFIDIPLFFEKKKFYPLKKSVVVYASKDIQLQRLMKRSNLSESEALKRIHSQMDIEKKRELADFVVDNSKDLKHLQNEVDRLAHWIKESYANLKI